MDKNGLGTLEAQAKLFYSLKTQGLKTVQQLKKYINKPSYNRQKKTFILSEVERMTGIPRSTIRDNEISKTFSYTKDDDKNISKRNYTIENVNEIREHFQRGFYGGKTKRPQESHTVTLAFSMFKGGVGKTTHACHMAAHCAISGLKTLLIDLDPQASATFMFGFVPSIDIRTGDTILNSLIEDFSFTSEIIKKTHYDGLDIITAGLELQAADIILPNNQMNELEKMGPPLLRLRKAISSVEQEYDVIILDCAPNHAAITMNALTAANSVIIPVSPSMLSYGSSIHFIQTLQELSETLIEYKSYIKESSPDDYNIIDNLSNQLFRILITNDPGDNESQDVTAAIRALYGEFVLPRTMSKTIALSRAANDIALLYDLKRSEVRRSKESFDRGLSAMKAVNDDILTVMASQWGFKYEA